jgi:thymidine kinase
VKPLTVVVGPVHSSKTTHALLVARQYEAIEKQVALFRPARSVRAFEGSDPYVIKAKNGLSFQVTANLSAPHEIRDLMLATFGGEDDFFEPPALVWIDEPALFEDQAGLVRAVAEIRAEVPVLVSGLSMTSEGRVFGTAMPQLLALADEIVSCRAACERCGRVGIATRSEYRGPRGAKSGDVLVGGTDVYAAVCAECWRG